MRLAPRFALIAAVLSAALAPPAQAQYLYLDANRDSLWSSADVLNPDTTTVFVWLNTNHDKDGSARVCNDHTGAASSTSTLNVFSYDLILHATGGTVAYSAFTSLGFNANGTEYQGDTDATVHRTRPLGSTLTGLHLLGYLTVTVTSGEPAIGIATATPIDPTAYGTGFGTDCDASEFANTYLLGTDWLDNDGVGEPQSPPEISAPSTVVQPEGTFLTVSASATDQDLSDHLTITASGYPSSLTLSAGGSGNTATATVSGVLSFTDAGIYQILWTATDSINVPVNSTTNLEVPEADQPPVITAPASVAGSEGSLVTVSVSAHDPDMQPIYSLLADLSSLPAGNDAVFTTSANKEQGALTWTPTFADAGSFIVIFTASNSSSTQDTTVINVANINPAPPRYSAMLPHP